MFAELLNLGPWTWAIIAALALLALLIVTRASGAVRYIPNSRIGVVEKLWSASGSVLRGLLAMHGEAGFQPDVLRGGFHSFTPLQYRVHICPMVSVTQGKIGYV